jgi:hypothetical protein
MEAATANGSCRLNRVDEETYGCRVPWRGVPFAFRSGVRTARALGGRDERDHALAGMDVRSFWSRNEVYPPSRVRCTPFISVISVMTITWVPFRSNEIPFTCTYRPGRASVSHALQAQVSCVTQFPIGGHIELD